ncbi:MAG: phosphoadenylyl-sulfate reductase [Chitinophagaceae bacterium]|nr:MAG: phosphoadenylyl-sulfate reductase [Chitinophagaceae bacterium]
MVFLQELNDLFAGGDAAAALRRVSALFPGRAVFSTSLGQEDGVITDLIARNAPGIRIFTIDTGRLFAETYETLDRTVARYKLPVEVFFPQAEAVQALVRRDGINGFYESVEQRKNCCGVRKVEPLARALQGAQAWITGLRAEQNEHRKTVPFVEWLPDKELYKINPLLHWGYDDVLAYLQQYNVPYNPLHDRGFISIGCAPCTRAVSEGEDPRAGRWWWESSQKECGLHLVK